jgi:hypothetical protein
LGATNTSSASEPPRVLWCKYFVPLSNSYIQTLISNEIPLEYGAFGKLLHHLREALMNGISIFSK